MVAVKGLTIKGTIPFDPNTKSVTHERAASINWRYKQVALINRHPESVTYKQLKYKIVRKSKLSQLL